MLFTSAFHLCNAYSDWGCRISRMHFNILQLMVEFAIKPPSDAHGSAQHSSAHVMPHQSKALASAHNDVCLCRCTFDKFPLNLTNLMVSFETSPLEHWLLFSGCHFHAQWSLSACTTEAFADMCCYMQYLGNDGMFPSYDMKGAQN